jgi:hypothetical protein
MSGIPFAISRESGDSQHRTESVCKAFLECWASGAVKAAAWIGPASLASVRSGLDEVSDIVGMVVD